MHVTMYCYIHLRCISYYYMYPCMADGDTRVSVGDIYREVNLTSCRGIGISMQDRAFTGRLAVYYDMMHCRHDTPVIHCKCTVYTVSQL